MSWLCVSISCAVFIDSKLAAVRLAAACCTADYNWHTYTPAGDANPRLQPAACLQECHLKDGSSLLRGDTLISRTRRSSQDAMAQRTLIVWGLDAEDPTYEQQLRVFIEHGELDRCLS